MNSLIQINTNESGASVVSARELHEKLGLNKTAFARWAKKNITENAFACQNEDWVMLDMMSSNGNKVEDYALTLDFSKRLAMMARTPEGEAVRQYFIECEKKLIEAQAPAALPATPAELILQMAQAMVSNERRVANLESRLERVEQVQQAATVELLELPAPTEAMPDLSTADKVRRMVNVYASAKGKPAQEIWRELYSELYYRYKVMANGIKLEGRESKLAALVRLGHIDKLFNVALHRLRIE